MDFDRICMMFTMQEPFYGILLSSMNRVATERIPTLAISKSGNVFQFNYNPKFLEKFNVNTIIEFIKHEILHVAFDHFSLWETPPSSPDEQRLRNIAADMEVNCYLNVNNLQEEAKRGLEFASKKGYPNYLGTREYYKNLSNEAEQKKQQAQANQLKQQCNGGQGWQSQQSNQQSTNSHSNKQQDSQSNQSNQSQNQSNGQQDITGYTTGYNNGGNNNQMPGSDSGSQAMKDFLDQFKDFDDHSQWPQEDPNSPEAKQTSQMIEDMLDFAAEECEKNCGEVPSEMKGRIDKIRKRPKPVADWKRYFRRYLGNEFSELIRKSKKRESRRFPDAAGNRHRRKSHILVAIDTSGSVSMPEYREFFGQIKTLTQSATFHVVECDTRIQYEYDFNGHIPEILHGGGGTSFKPPVDIFNNNKRKYDALVYFTDGYSSIPHDTPKETLWVISSEGDHNRNKYKRNGANVVFIPPKQ